MRLSQLLRHTARRLSGLGGTPPPSQTEWGESMNDPTSVSSVGDDTLRVRLSASRTGPGEERATRGSLRPCLFLDPGYRPSSHALATQGSMI